MALEEAEARPKRDGRKERGEHPGTLATYVRERILQDMLQGTICAADVIQLRTLADRYGVSKTPVREALSQLQREGLADSLPYKGYFVRPMDVSEFNEVFHLRALLEGAGAELAARTMSERDLEELAALQPPSGAGPTPEHDEYAHRFHALIARASGSRRLHDMFEKLYIDVRRLTYRGAGCPDATESAREHQDIAQALQARDPEAARQAMVRHIENVKKRVLSGPARPPVDNRD
jgi:DNA-binding GntR family transcriptional regulator